MARSTLPLSDSPRRIASTSADKSLAPQSSCMDPPFSTRRATPAAATASTVLVKYPAERRYLTLRSRAGR